MFISSDMEIEQLIQTRGYNGLGYHELNVPDENGDTIVHKLIKTKQAKILYELNTSFRTVHFIDLNKKDRDGRTGLYLLVTLEQDFDDQFDEYTLADFIEGILDRYEADLNISDLDKLPYRALRNIEPVVLEEYYQKHQELSMSDLDTINSKGPYPPHSAHWAITYFNGNVTNEVVDLRSEGMNQQELLMTALAEMIVVHRRPKGDKLSVWQFIKIFIDNGIDVNEDTSDGEKLIQKAAFSQNVMAVKTFRYFGAEYNVKNLIELARDGRNGYYRWHHDSQELKEYLEYLEKRHNAAISWISINKRNALGPKLNDHSRANVVELL